VKNRAAIAHKRFCQKTSRLLKGRFQLLDFGGCIDCIHNLGLDEFGSADGYRDQTC
jgi:hypothetical protein